MEREFVDVTECRLLHNKLETALAELNSKLQGVTDLVERVDKRLYRDNGTLSIQTRLDRHEQVLRVIMWVGSITVGFLLLVVLGAIATHILGVDPGVLP